MHFLCAVKDVKTSQSAVHIPAVTHVTGRRGSRATRRKFVPH